MTFEILFPTAGVFILLSILFALFATAKAKEKIDRIRQDDNNDVDSKTQKQISKLVESI
jgi:hypothetical protein